MGGPLIVLICSRLATMLTHSSEAELPCCCCCCSWPAPCLLRYRCSWWPWGSADVPSWLVGESALLLVNLAAMRELLQSWNAWPGTLDAAAAADAVSKSGQIPTAHVKGRMMLTMHQAQYQHHVCETSKPVCRNNARRVALIPHNGTQWHLIGTSRSVQGLHAACGTGCGSAGQLA